MKRTVSRRAALRLGAVGAGVSLAGCAGGIPLLSGSSVSDSPATESTEFSTNFVFTREGERYLSLQMQYDDQSKPAAYHIPIRFSVWHQRDTHLDSLWYALRPRLGFEHPVLFYTRVPRPNFPDHEFEQTADGRGMRFDVPDLGRYGRGTVVTEFFTRIPSNEATIDVLPMVFHAEFQLSEEHLLGGDHTLQIEETVDIPVRPNR